MESCSGDASSDGYCDDYNHNHDYTQNHPDWINGTYDFTLLDTGTIELNMVWAIHEFDREKVGLNDAFSTTILEDQDNLDSDDGAPADLLRQNLGKRVGGSDGPTVQQKLILELSNSVQESLENIGNLEDIDTEYVNNIEQEGVVTTCSIDNTTDSVYGGENAAVNNVFQPPICIGTTARLQLTDTNFGIQSTGGLNLDDAFEGMLVMGAEIDLELKLLTIPGSVGYYSFTPPDYAMITELPVSEADSQTLISDTRASWEVNRANPVAGDGNETNISVILGHKDGYANTNTVSIAEDSKALDLRVELDLRDESAATIEFVAGINHLSDTVMSDWGISLLELSESATLPVVTSDGIRLAYHNGLLPLDDIASAFPIEDIAEGVGESVGTDAAIAMNPLSWIQNSASEDSLDQPGGLSYLHSDCPKPNNGYYCLRGPSAMGNDYPVFLRSTSEPFSASLIDILKDNFGGGDLAQYTEVIQESDLRNLFNSGISIESVLQGDLLDSVIPDDLPPAELTLEIILPSWVRTVDGGDRLTLQKTLDGTSDVNISLAGSNPYDWRTDIMDEDMNVICTSLQRTCISSSVELDISALRIKEWSQSVSLDFALDAEVSIYRVIVPLDDINQSESAQINFESAPSDLLRVGLDIASRLAEPKVFDNLGNICRDDQDYSVCEENLSMVFTPEGITEFSVDIGKMITDFIHQSSAEIPNEPDSPYGAVDLSGFQIETVVDGLSGLDQDIGDDDPITLSVNIPKVEFKLELDGNMGEIIDGDTSSLRLNFFANAFSELIVNPMVSAAELLGSSLTNGLVSGEGITYPAPEGEATSYTFTGNSSINEDYDLSITGPISVILPRGITIEDVEDNSGNLVITEVGKRQKITYNIPVGDFEDTITFRIKVSWFYLLVQFWVYPTFVVLLMGLFIRRRRRKKRLKRERKSAAAQRTTKVAIGDSEFADLRGFKSEGLHGELQQFEDYSTQPAPSMIDLGDERFD